MNALLWRAVATWPELVALSFEPSLAWSRAIQAIALAPMRPLAGRDPLTQGVAALSPLPPVAEISSVRSGELHRGARPSEAVPTWDAEEVAEALAFHHSHVAFQEAWQELHTTPHKADPVLNLLPSASALALEWRARTGRLPEVGQSALTIKTFRQEDVAQFARLSGDQNPLHLDPTAWVGTPFTGNFVHGVLTASLFSQLLGMELPGPGAIYLSQTLRFQAPVYIGDTVSAQVTVTSVRDDKRIVTLRTQASVQREGAPIIVLEGEAVVKMLNMSAVSAPPP